MTNSNVDSAPRPQAVVAGERTEAAWRGRSVRDVGTGLAASKSRWKSRPWKGRARPAGRRKRSATRFRLQGMDGSAAVARLSLGQRIADAVASVRGSWSFIIVQSAILFVWITANLIGAMRGWDPYPFILLNLALSSRRPTPRQLS